MNKKLTVAAFGAHPDDIEWSMMGTLIKYKEQGHNVHMVVATDGGRGGDAAVRKQEAIAAAAHIGIEPVLLNFEDGRLVYTREIYEKFIEAYDKIKPDVVFTHDPDNDYHPDHRKVGRLVTDTSWVPVFYADTMAGLGFVPQFYVDITDQMQFKKKIISEHKSQMHTRYLEVMEVQNRFRGLQCNWSEDRYAEAFRLFPRIEYVQGYRLLPE